MYVAVHYPDCNTGVKALSHLGKGEEQLYRRNCSMCYGISSVFPPPP